MQDPVKILNEYGADAMRLYLITSPVVHGDNLAFKEAGVKEVIRSVFLPWYNAYRFLVQNALRHEKDTGEKFDPTKVSSISCKSSHLKKSLLLIRTSRMFLLARGFDFTAHRVSCTYV